MSNLAELQDHDREALVLAIKQNVREAANLRLGSSLSGMKLEPVDAFEYHLDEDEDWLVKIVVNADGIKFKFKVYYSVDIAKTFLSQKKALQNRAIAPSLCHDFIREFCNLTAGAIKIWLQSNYSSSNEAGELIVNLPDQKPAAIEPLEKMEKDIQNSQETLVDKWCYRLNDQSLICAVEVRITDWDKMQNLMSGKEEAGIDDQDDSGNIEFL
ncbi:MAG: hypothetical protein ACOH5I_18180 [Oligoflexus sp.]